MSLHLSQKLPVDCLRSQKSQRYGFNASTAVLNSCMATAEYFSVVQCGR